jgi:hypothetical protein
MVLLFFIRKKGGIKPSFFLIIKEPRKAIGKQFRLTIGYWREEKCYIGEGNGV